eukprot:12464762-Alexandrium_andersonii.AAC.1
MSASISTTAECSHGCRALRNGVLFPTTSSDGPKPTTFFSNACSPETLAVTKSSDSRVEADNNLNFHPP